MGLISIIYAALGVSVIFIVLDQLAKWAVAATLAASAPVTVIPGIFQLTYVENTGAAFSSFDGQRWFLIIVTGLVILGLLYLMLFHHIRNRFVIWCLSGIIAGGIGNLIDRIFHGYVIDYIQLTFIDFAIFNFADCLVVVGVVLLLVYLLFFHKEEKILYFDKHKTKF